MSDNTLNKDLDKHLVKYGLSSTILPSDLEQWQQFIIRLNHHYMDTEQERYILERSSEIASRESMDLTKKLESAQRLAHIGRWHFNRPNNKMTVSKEFYDIFGLDPSIRFRTFEQVQQNIHRHDNARFMEMINNSFNKGLDEECEVRMIMPNKKFLWFLIICHPIANKDGVIEDIEGIAMEITKRKESEEKILQLNQQIVSAARFAGMAEIATSILHNLGNILNSANVSLNILKETVSQPYIDKVLKAIDLMAGHMTALDAFLTTDEKGKLIPKYLVASSSVVKSEQVKIKAEISNLNVHLNHIKDIVAVQQNVANSASVVEKIFIPEVLDLALQMCAGTAQNNNIKIIKDYYDFYRFIETDKAKLLQILVNLIHNAEEATEENKKLAVKEITISAHESENKQIEIIVKDNGIGISKENQTKIFAFGYTSKKEGHGFGLHSSALFAKEMGGDLQVTSEGLGFGATFILRIPVSQQEVRSYEHNQ